jgi:hypothetical protein
MARDEGIEREMETLYMSAREGLAPETSGRTLRHQSSSGGSNDFSGTGVSSSLLLLSNVRVC